MSDFADTMETYFYSRLCFYLHNEFGYSPCISRKAQGIDTSILEEEEICAHVAESDLRLAVVLAEEDWMDELQSHLSLRLP